MTFRDGVKNGGNDSKDAENDYDCRQGEKDECKACDENVNEKDSTGKMNVDLGHEDEVCTSREDQSDVTRVENSNAQVLDNSLSVENTEIISENVNNSALAALTSTENVNNSALSVLTSAESKHEDDGDLLRKVAVELREESVHSDSEDSGIIDNSECQMPLDGAEDEMGVYLDSNFIDPVQKCEDFVSVENKESAERRLEENVQVSIQNKEKFLSRDKQDAKENVNEGHYQDVGNTSSDLGLRGIEAGESTQRQTEVEGTLQCQTSNFQDTCSAIISEIEFHNVQSPRLDNQKTGVCGKEIVAKSDEKSSGEVVKQGHVSSVPLKSCMKSKSMSSSSCDSDRGNARKMKLKKENLINLTEYEKSKRKISSYSQDSSSPKHLTDSDTGSVFSPDDMDPAKSFIYDEKSSPKSEPSMSWPSNRKLPAGLKPLGTKKPFNPFPVQHFNENRARTGIKLGIYKSSTFDEFEKQTKRRPLWSK